MHSVVLLTVLLSFLQPGLQSAPFIPEASVPNPSIVAVATSDAQAMPGAFTRHAFLPLLTVVPAVSTRYFSTLPPGTRLPSDAECAAAIKPRPENKRMNRTYNAVRGSQQLASNFFTGGNPLANTLIASRVTGNYVGSTDEIIQWTACKWGIDEDIVRAQAALESWWRQTNMDNWTTDPSRCAPGHEIGRDGRVGECPRSFGILQVMYYYFQSAWPGSATSTAFNMDTAYAVWRACYEGFETWLMDVTHVGTYGPGDLWGCIGRWNTGKWHTPQSETYISDVQSRLNTRFWEQPVFQEP
jgi:autotransporter family porin